MPDVSGEVRFTRVISLGDFGTDCEGVGRALCREGSGATLAAFMEQKIERRRTWNEQKHDWLEKFEKKMGATPDGVYGRWIHGKLTPYFDARASYLMLTWKPPPPPLVEPRQGFDSLHKSLWDIYSVGRRMGMFDLGTWNPASTLPSGGPSDHSVYPAYAFDLGIDPDSGYAHPTGRAFFHICMTRPEVEYVILGNKIGFRRTGVIATYSDGGHSNHCHVSGNR